MGKRPVLNGNRPSRKGNEAKTNRQLKEQNNEENPIFNQTNQGGFFGRKQDSTLQGNRNGNKKNQTRQE